MPMTPPTTPPTMAPTGVLFGSPLPVSAEPVEVVPVGELAAPRALEVTEVCEVLEVVEGFVLFSGVSIPGFLSMANPPD